MGVKQKMGHKVYIGIIVLLVAAVVYLLYSFGNAGITGNIVNENATQNVKDIYKLLTDKDVEVLSVKEESGVYKVVIKTIDLTGTPIAQDIYVTKDGKLITDKFLNADQYKASLASNKNFINCLSEKGVRVVGQSSNNYTVMQMQVLGNFGYMIYFDCVGNNMQICEKIGVKSIPSVLYNQTIYEGIKSVQWFEDTTGCNAEG